MAWWSIKYCDRCDDDMVYPENLPVWYCPDCKCEEICADCFLKNPKCIECGKDMIQKEP